MEIINWFTENYAQVVVAIGLLYSFANIVVGWTDSPEDDAALAKIRKFLVFISVLEPKNSEGTIKPPLKGPSPKVPEKPKVPQGEDKGLWN